MDLRGKYVRSQKRACQLPALGADKTDARKPRGVFFPRKLKSGHPNRNFLLACSAEAACRRVLLHVDDVANCRTCRAFNVPMRLVQTWQIRHLFLFSRKSAVIIEMRRRPNAMIRSLRTYPIPLKISLTALNGPRKKHLACEYKDVSSRWPENYIR